jgi:hypothetical protein
MEEQTKTKNKTQMQNHKDYVNFYNRNKERISEKVKCEICGGSYTYYNKSCHLKSKKHIKCVTYDAHEVEKLAKQIEELEQKRLKILQILKTTV